MKVYLGFESLTLRHNIMNNQDKEEFEKWLNENKSSLVIHGGLKKMDDDFHLCWKTACDYMRNKSNPLDALSLYEKLETERAENKKLKDALKNCLIMSPLDPFERGDMIREALKEVGEA